MDGDADGVEGEAGAVDVEVEGVARELQPAEAVAGEGEVGADGRATVRQCEACAEAAKGFGAGPRCLYGEGGEAESAAGVGDEQPDAAVALQQRPLEPQGGAGLDLRAAAVEAVRAGLGVCNDRVAERCGGAAADEQSELVVGEQRGCIELCGGALCDEEAHAAAAVACLGEGSADDQLAHARGGAGAGCVEAGEAVAAEQEAVCDEGGALLEPDSEPGAAVGGVGAGGGGGEVVEFDAAAAGRKEGCLGVARQQGAVEVCDGARLDSNAVACAVAVGLGALDEAVGEGEPGAEA